MKTQMVNVYVSEDPQLSHVVLQTLTKSGRFIDMSGARWQIASGAVMVDGQIVTDMSAILEPGMHRVSVGDRLYDICLHHALME